MYYFFYDSVVPLSLKYSLSLTILYGTKFSLLGLGTICLVVLVNDLVHFNKLRLLDRLVPSQLQDLY